MSYILDALRKADAERERGLIPGIHAQQAGHEADAETADRSKPLLWAVIGLLLALVAALTWNTLGRDAIPRVADNRAAPSNPVAAAQPSQEAAPATTSALTPATNSATVPGATAAATPPTAVPAPVVATTAGRPAAATTAVAPTPSAKSTSAAQMPKPKHATRKAAAAATDTDSKQAAQPAARPPAAAKPTTTDKHVYSLNELPTEIRQQLPALVVGGASYSTNPASRMLVINGQVFHERDRLAPELFLQQIKLKAAVLEYKGYRYEIKY